MVCQGDPQAVALAIHRSNEEVKKGATAASLAVVRDCPYRGATLPHNQQPACGCGELTECRAKPKPVTLADCLTCVAAPK